MSLYFISIRSRNSSPVFGLESEFKDAVRNIITKGNSKDFSIKAYCLMPESLKLVVELQGFKECTNHIFVEDSAAFLPIEPLRELISNADRLVYQCVRIDRPLPLYDLVDYIETEPVRAGLVDQPFMYPYSSAYDPEAVHKFNHQSKLHFTHQCSAKSWRDCDV